MSFGRKTGPTFSTIIELKSSNRRQVEVVKLFLEKGANIIARDKNGRTPLISAACSGHVDVVRLLLEKGANAKFSRRKKI